MYNVHELKDSSVKISVISTLFHGISAIEIITADLCISVKTNQFTWCVHSRNSLSCTYDLCTFLHIYYTSVF